MRSDERWSFWIESGARERERVRQRFRELEFASGEMAAEVTSGLEKAGNSLKWGGLALLVSAALLRMTTFRKGFRSARWLLTLAPVVARFAGSQILPGLHPFRRRDAEKT
ncbi:MAG: hypothetical protein ACRD16_07330 [Thermoanaerobaculia bacterium]